MCVSLSSYPQNATAAGPGIVGHCANVAPPPTRRSTGTRTRAHAPIPTGNEMNRRAASPARAREASRSGPSSCGGGAVRGKPRAGTRGSARCVHLRLLVHVAGGRYALRPAPRVRRDVIWECPRHEVGNLRASRFSAESRTCVLRHVVTEFSLAYLRSLAWPEKQL